MASVGKGGMGEVLRVEDLLHERKIVALKRFRIDAAKDAVDLFRQEFLTLTQLRHPNVAQVFDFGTIPETGEAYFTTELVPGIELFEATDGISWEALVDVVVQLCRGLAYVHSRGLIHRDVKPSNVLVVEDGGRRVVKLIDFGLATELRAGLAEKRAPLGTSSKWRALIADADAAAQAPPAAPDVTTRVPDGPRPPSLPVNGDDTTPGESTMKEALTVRERSIRGTVHYLAPEVASGLPAGRRSDLYALGVTLFQVVTRELPFRGGTAREVLARHIALRPPSPRALRHDCPEPLERIILRLLEKDPERRYASADQVIGDLASLAGRAIPVETRETEESYVFSGRLVGREAELDLLRRGVDQAFGAPGAQAQACPSLFVVSGEMGIGKTRLLKELKNHVQVTRKEAIEAACDPGGRAYGAVVEAARKLMTLVRPQAEALLGPSAPLVRAFLGEEGRDEAAPATPAAPSRRASARIQRDAGRERLRLFDAVVTFFLAATYARPAVVFLHELERADEETLALVTHLARAIGLASKSTATGTRPALLLVASLDDGAPALPAQDGAAAVDTASRAAQAVQALEEEELARRVRLAPLTPEAVLRLVAGMLGLGEERSLEAAVLARHVHRETGGNPFLIEEALKSLLSSGRIRAEAGGFRIEADLEGLEASSAPPAAPPRIREVFQARLEELPEASRRALETLAVARRPAPLALLAAAHGGAAERLTRQLEAHRRRGMVVRSEEGALYRFAHELFRRVVYDAIAPERRRRLHAAIGAALESGPPALLRGPAEEAGAEPAEGATALSAALVEHFAAAGDARRTFRYAVDAGREAQSLFANERAAAFYDRALETARAAPEAATPLERAGVLEALGSVRERTGDHVSAAACFRRILDPTEGLATALGPTGLARVHRRLGESFAARGGHDQALESFGAGLRLLGQGDRINSVEGAKLLGATASTYVKLGLHDMAIAFCKSGLGWLGEPGTGTAEWAAIRNTIGVAHSCTGRYEEAAAEFETALAARETLHDLEGEAQTLNNLGAVFVERGQVGRAIAFFEQAFERCEHTGDARGTAEAASHLASAYATLGQEERALRLFARALEIHERIGDPEATTAALARLGTLECEQGDYADACGRLERARRLARRAGDSRAAVTAFTFAGRLLGRLGDAAQSEASLAQALALAERLGLAREEAEARLLLGRLLRSVGRLDEAERELSAALAAMERLGNDLEAAGATVAVLETLLDRGDLDLAQLVARKLDALGRDARAGRLLARLEYALGRLELALAVRAAGEGSGASSDGAALGGPGSGALRAVGALPPHASPRGLKDQRISEAVRRFEKAREIAKAERRPELVWRAEHALARAFEAGGAHDRCLAAAVRAMETLRELFARVPTEHKERFLSQPARQSVRADFARWKAAAGDLAK